MTGDQATVFAVLAAALLLFLWGRLRYDVVALLALLAVVLSGEVDAADAFSGFGHPAVVAVAAVLVVSRALSNSGLVDVISARLLALGGSFRAQALALVGLTTLLSGFMNNVGALALLMPVAIRIAKKHEAPPSAILMPLAFASLLGGLVTLVGTPPNIVIAAFRRNANGDPFRMFDFTPVGLPVAAAGVVLLTFFGSRLIPRRQPALSAKDFELEEYLAEVLVEDESAASGSTIRDLEARSGHDVTAVALVRGGTQVIAPSPYWVLRPGDIVGVRASQEALGELTSREGLRLRGDTGAKDGYFGSDAVAILEAVVLAGAPIEGASAGSLQLRSRRGVNLLAISRQGHAIIERLHQVRFRAGDVLLLHGAREILPQALREMGCLPLAERELSIGQRRQVVLAALVGLAGIAAAATGVLPIQIAVVAAAVSMLLLGVLSLEDAYDSVDWPVIILLGAMIPVGLSLETTGAARLVADAIVDASAKASPEVALLMVLIGTMFLSDLINNAAAAVLMAPIGVATASALGVSADPFLMAIAVGASCAFLTPIGHQSNTLVMGPGGYRFSDYWRMGIVIEAAIVAVATPMILIVWPL